MTFPFAPVVPVAVVFLPTRSVTFSPVIPTLPSLARRAVSFACLPLTMSCEPGVRVS